MRLAWLTLKSEPGRVPVRGYGVGVGGGAGASPNYSFGNTAGLIFHFFELKFVVRI